MPRIKKDTSARIVPDNSKRLKKLKEDPQKLEMMHKTQQKDIERYNLQKSVQIFPKVDASNYKQINDNFMNRFKERQRRESEINTPPDTSSLTKAAAGIELNSDQIHPSSASNDN